MSTPHQNPRHFFHDWSFDVGGHVEFGAPMHEPQLPFMANGMPFSPFNHFGFHEQAHAYAQAQAQTFAQAQAAPQTMRNGPPPASQTILERLPMVTVTNEDLQEETNSGCSICLDEHALGDSVLKLPCGHIFHRDCVVEWLHKHCTCPVCRYELGTDNAEFERQRKERMSDRKLRFRLKDLQAMSVAQLRALMREAGVSASGCLEKQELIDRFKASSHVVVLDSNVPQYSLEQLLAMSPGELRRLLQSFGLRHDHCLEKSDLIAELRTSHKIQILNDDTSGVAIPHTDFYNGYDQTPTPDNETKDHEQSYPDADSHPKPNPSEWARLNSLSVRELRAILNSINVPVLGLLEKSDLIAAIVSSGHVST